MRYEQITPGERYTLAALHAQQPRLSIREIGRRMERSPSTISRELRRNASGDGRYRVEHAQEHTNARRRRSRRNSHFTAADWRLVEVLLRAHLSPEQISGRLARERILHSSHETIYTHVWRDKRRGGDLFRSLRQPTKRRKRYGTYEKRGQVSGKRHISTRPAAAERRQEIGHWEMDTIVGTGSKDCVLSLVERVSGFLLMGKLPNRSAAALNGRLVRLIRKNRRLFKTITADNGTEFHGYRAVERATGVPIYFATPYHSWERGTNENTNGLIRQYLPKRTSMRGLTQIHCNAIARALNHRPRKRHDFRNPIEVLRGRPRA